MTNTIDDRLSRIVHAEFQEMPGLRLTRQQAQRLWGLDPATCADLLSALVDAGFLTLMPDGHFARVGDGEAVTRHPTLKTAARPPIRPHVS